MQNHSLLIRFISHIDLSWGILGPSWDRLGAILAVCGAILVSSWIPKVVKMLGRSFKNEQIAMSTQCSYDIFSSISASSVQKAILSRLGTILARLRGHLGPSWGHLGRTWGHLGAILGALSFMSRFIFRFKHAQKCCKTYWFLIIF